MAKKLAKLLKTDSMGDLDTKVLAQILKSKGRKGDTMLAHINPQEAALLKKRGGSGTENPETGLPEFFVIDGDYAYGADYGNQQSAPTAYDYSPAPSASDLMSFGGGDLGGAASSSGYQYSNPVTIPEAVYNPSRDVFAGGNLNVPQTSSPEYAQAMRSYYQQPEMPTDVMGNKVIVPTSGSYAPGMPSGGRTTAGIVPPPGVKTPSGEPGAAPGAANQPPKDEYEFLKKLGLAGVSAIPGIYQSRKAQEQGQKGKAEQMALADPYRKEGQALLDKARSGELNAVGQQQMQQLEARLRQGQESRGGVGNAQVQAQMEAYRQQLLQNQYDLGLKVSGIGDQIALGAIKTGMEADRYVGELTGNYYNNMFRILSGASNQPTPPRG